MICDTIQKRFTEPEIKLQKAHLVYILPPVHNRRENPPQLRYIKPCVLTTSSVEFPQLIHSLKSGFVAVGFTSVVIM